MKNNILIIFLFAFTILSAQPPNDLCSGAYSITPDGTCYGPGQAETTTTGAGDEWVGTVGCQSGNNDEVWFTFVATGSQFDYSVTGGTMGNDIEMILVESSSPPCAGLSLEGSDCGTSVLSGTFQGLTVGATYYITISSSGANGTFTICTTTSTPAPSPGQDCAGASSLCDDSSFGVGTIASGSGTVSGNGSEEDISALSCFGSDEQQSQWYTFTVSSSGTAEFTIDPNVNTNDYDWVLFDITSSACNLSSGGATQVACNWSGCPGNTGITTGDPCTFIDYDCTGNPNDCVTGQVQTTAANLTAGNTYAMLIDNFSATNSGFNFDWGAASTSVVGPSADFSVTSCTEPNVGISLTYPVSDAAWTYDVAWGDGATNSYTGATVPNPITHNYTASNPAGAYNISVTVTDPLGCAKSFSATTCVFLSVDWLYFDAKPKNFNALIDWGTASEENSSYFIIQRSDDLGNTFKNVGTVQAAGNSSSSLNYQFVDEHPGYGDFLYRVIQYDENGNSMSTEAKLVTIKPGNPLVSVYPNPNDGNFTLSLQTLKNESVRVEVIDVAGRVMKGSTLYMQGGAAQIPFSVNNVAKGVYFIKTTADGYQPKLTKIIIE